MEKKKRFKDTSMNQILFMSEIEIARRHHTYWGKLVQGYDSGLGNALTEVLGERQVWLGSIR
jgi:hypothetical protein